MAKYRKKPVVIEAQQLTHWYDDATGERYRGNIDRILDWINEDKINPIARIDWDLSGDFGLIIETLEGNMYAGYKDWVIKGVKGEFYPCKPDIFDQSYEPVEED